MKFENLLKLTCKSTNRIKARREQHYCIVHSVVLDLTIISRNC